jgi:hypothetical protein
LCVDQVQSVRRFKTIENNMLQKRVSTQSGAAKSSFLIETRGPQPFFVK